MQFDKCAFLFEFVGYGEKAPAFVEGCNRLYLDVGNQLGPGVIDHHHLPAYAGSAAGLVVANPELVLQALKPVRGAGDPFCIVLHQHPDMDCLASAWLAIRVVSAGALPEGAELLSRYADRIDQGYPGMSLEQPFSLYAACMFLAHRLSQREWNDPRQQWNTYVAEALSVIDHVMGKVAGQGVSLFEVDAFECPGLFGRRDRDEITRDMERYRRKLADLNTHTRRITLRLPGQFGGLSEVNTLMVRNVQNADDPDRVMFFKDWARTDKASAPGGKGFEALSVFESGSGAAGNRCIVSVTPQSGVCLRGFGAILDRMESDERIKRCGMDDREEDPVTHEKRAPRQGYTNSDPWYDGRAHAYTIVDAPRAGSVLTADQMEDALVLFGRKTAAAVEPFYAIRRSDEGVKGGRSEDQIRQTANLIASWKQSNPSGPVIRPDVFISYSHRKADWVKSQVYAPLCSWLGPEKVFFDAECLQGGMGWLAKLSEVVNACRVFIPVYCPEYFLSDFCQWELMQAIVRDPVGARRIVIPVMMGETVLPDYCKLIQAMPVERPDFQEQLMEIVRDVLK
jgi:hypothetical protein